MSDSNEQVMDMNDGEAQTVEPLVPSLGNVPWRVREIAMLRGLVYSYRQIAQESKITPQPVSLMHARRRRPVKSLRQQMDLLGLSPGVVNVLARHGINKREQALTYPLLDRISNGRNCGSKTIEEIRRWIEGEENLPSSGPALRS